jgi:hypothetical protein
MNKLEKKYRITYNSWQGYYVVHTAQGEVRFYKYKNGLLFIDLDKSSEDTATMLVQTGLEDVTNALVQTVRQNYKGYTKKEILQAKEARWAMGMIEKPREQDFKGMVRGNMIYNCPVTTKAITNMHAIHGPSLESMRSKTVRQTPALVVVEYVAVPKEIMECNKIVTLAANLFFVDGTAFLLTVSRQIKLITMEYVAVRTAKSLSKHLK